MARQQKSCPEFNCKITIVRKLSLPKIKRVASEYYRQCRSKIMARKMDGGRPTDEEAKLFPYNTENLHVFKA